MPNTGPIANLTGKVNANNELVVAATVVATGADGAIIDGVDPAVKATVFDRTNSNPLAVQMVDSSGSPLAGSAVSIADGADVAEGTTTDAAIVTSTAGTVIGFLRGAIVQWGKLLAQLIDYDTGAGTQNTPVFGIALPASGGPVAGGTATNPIRIDPTGTTPMAITAAALPLPAGASTSAKQDTAQTAHDATLAAVGATTNAGVITDAAGSVIAFLRGAVIQWAKLVAQILDFDTAGGTANTPIFGIALPASGGPVAGGTATNPLRVDPTNTTPLQVVGSVADDGVTPGAPVQIGGIAKQMDGTDPGNVSAENDVTGFITDMQRRQYVNTVHPMDWSYHEDSSSQLTDQSVKAAPGASYALFITDIVISTNAASAFNVFFEEGTTTKVLGPFYLEAVAGRGVVINFRTPKRITANTSFTVTTSAATAHSIDVQGFTARVA